MSTETTRSPALVAVLSILGILALSIVAGMLLFQMKESPGNTLDIGTALSYKDAATPQDEFDPISWAREGASYPPLEDKASDDDGYKVDYTGDSAIPADSSDENADTTISKQGATQQTVSVVTTNESVTPPQPVYKEVRENAWWVQAGSWQNASSAEKVREELADVGFSANVIAQDLDGITWYRVRVGAFTEEEEAELYAGKIHRSTSFTTSFVVQAPVTRRVAVEN